MSSETQILREYLVALGFKVDEKGSRDFDTRLIHLDKRGGQLGKTLVGVGVAAVTLSTVFARSMEKLYYSARYADTSVGSLQGLEYGMRNIGFEGGQATATLKAFSQAVRSNPGLIGMLEKLGVQVKGRTMDKVMVDFVKATKSMPSYVSQRYASLFGMDPETLFNLQQGVDAMEKAVAARRDMASEMGVDPDKTAEVAREYMNMWRDVVERAGMFGQVIGTLIMPKVKELVETTHDLMKDWVSIAREIDKNGSSDFWKRMREGTTGKAEGERVTLSPEAKARVGAPMYDIGVDQVDPALGHVPRWKRILKKIAPKQFGERPATDQAAVDAVDDRESFNRKPVSETERVAVQSKRLDEAKRAREEAATAAPDARPAEPSQAGAAPNPPGAAEKPARGPANGPRKPINPRPLTEEDLLARREAEKDALVRPDVPEEPGWKTEPSLDPQRYMAALERRYALPKGLLDRVWNRESHRGDPKLMRSPAGARGHFGFMPDTQQEYGLKDPDDFRESAVAAARKWRDLLKQYGGDLRRAAAAYNWGDGKLERFGLGAAPRETRGYMDAVAGPVTVEAKPEIHIHGVHDPQAAADSVVRKQRDVNGDLVRNMSPKVR